jgi:mannitol/fructose-specific phosphotransferase system IIA component (Ntr-type)
MVKINAQTIRPATPQRTAESLFVEPTPTIDPVMVCVVTGLRPEEISVPVLRRERAMATGIGNGIAVPHARVNKLRKPIVSVALSEFGVDFDAPDGEKAQLIFLTLLPETDEGTLLLDVHADIARKFSSEEMRRSAFQTRNFHEFLGLLKHDGA